MAALAALGRPEDAIPILKSIVSVDFPAGNVKHTFVREVLDSLREAVDKTGNADLTLEFDRIIELFEKEGHIADVVRFGGKKMGVEFKVICFRR